MKKTLIPVLFLFLYTSLLAQWERIPGTANWPVSEMELSGNYLFVTNSRDDSTFLRIDLSDQSRQIMINPHGIPFSKYGWKRMAAIGEHILYTDRDTIFASHDYGNTWSKPDPRKRTGAYFLAQDDVFLAGVFRTLLKSVDFGYSFEALYNENYYTNTTLRPLLLKDSTVYFSEEGGLISIHLNGGRITNLERTPNLFLSMTAVGGDTLIASSKYDIYRSTNSGQSWTRLNREPFGRHFIKEVIFEDSILYVSPATVGVQVSFDLGQTFFDFSEGLPPNTGSRRLKFDEQYLYAATGDGVYRRLRSDIVKRAISGQVYLDANHNQQKDSLEQGLSNQLLKLANRNHFGFTNEDGFFRLEYVGLTDTLQYVPQQPYYLAHPANFHSEELYDSIDIAIQIDSTITNLSVAITPFTNSRPGFETRFGINVESQSIIPTQAHLEVVLDPILSLVQANDTDYTIDGQTISWTVNLTPFERDFFSVTCLLPQDVNLLGDSLKVVACLTPLQEDIMPEDNTDTLHQVITGSFDPNDKNVIPGKEILPSFIAQEEWLDYFVRFQNTGTDTAFTISIKDSLSPHLAVETFRFVGSSHPCTIEIDTTNTLYFHFEDILLPDSITNEPGSHGYVRYRIKPKKNIELEDVILNTADIFFDFNPPITTNTTVTKYTDRTVASVEVTKDSFIKSQPVFPNPTDGVIYVPSGREARIEVYDLAGRKIDCTIVKTNNMMMINLSDQPPGIYLVSIVESGDNLRVEKVVKF